MKLGTIEAVEVLKNFKKTVEDQTMVSCINMLILMDGDIVANGIMNIIGRNSQMSENDVLDMIINNLYDICKKFDLQYDESLAKGSYVGILDMGIFRDEIKDVILKNIDNISDIAKFVDIFDETMDTVISYINKMVEAELKFTDNKSRMYNEFKERLSKVNQLKERNLKVIK